MNNEFADGSRDDVYADDVCRFVVWDGSTSIRFRNDFTHILT